MSRAPAVSKVLGEMDLAALPPLVSGRRAAWIADCHRSTLQRRGPKPVGKRGRAYFYRTSDILAWLESGLESMPSATRETGNMRPRHATSATSAALERLSLLKGGLK